MQPTHSSRRLLQPARMWFVHLSLLLALGLAYIPNGRLPGVPDWVALVLTFWCVREPHRISMGAGFLFGVLVDIGHGAALGQHALAYVVLAYLAGVVSRRILWFSPWQQSLQMLPLFLVAQAIMLAVRWVGGGEVPGWSYFLASLSSALLWPLMTMILLLPQYRPVERDENRPI